VETTQQPLIISRTLTGRGQQHGGLLTTFRNPSPREVTLVYLETLPWFLKPHYHTLRSTSTIGGEDSTWNRNLRESSNIVDSMFYRPAVDRTRASHLEAILRVQANSTLTLTYEFEKAILRYTEYPPDANRGFDIAPAIVKVFAPGQENVGVYDPDSRPSYRYTGKGTYMRTTSLLLYLPTPDFSMPYNVVCTRRTHLPWQPI
jgi:phosphatidylinositol glycan class T